MTPRPNIRIFISHLVAMTPVGEAAYNWRSSPLQDMETISICQRRHRVTTAKPLRADARRNRDALLAKARELFASGCFDMRFDDFARLAGVGTGTLYRHFPTRAALAEAVYREEL